MNFKKIFLPVVVIFLIAFLFYKLNDKPTSPNVTFTTIEGRKINMAELKGKVVLVNFWATDCPGCIKEMPDLVNAYKNYHEQGLEILAVAMPYDPPAQVLNYATQKKLPFPVMHDGLGEMVKAFGGVNLTPTTFIYNKQGERLQRTIGELDFAKFDQLVKKELSQ